MPANVNKARLAIIIGIFIVIAVIIAIAVPLALRESDDEKPDDSDIKPSEMRVDCFPDGNKDSITKEECESRGCKYKSDSDVVCYYTSGQYSLNASVIDQTADKVIMKLQQSGKSPFEGDIKEWIFTFENKGDNVARFKFDTAAGNRYKVPKHMNLPTTPGSAPNYEIKFTNNETFSFQIIRKVTGKVIWDIGVGPGNLILSDQFLQITTKLPSKNVYGLGEHLHGSLRHDFTKTWPSFARDQPPGWGDSANLYGVHPFYTCVEDSYGNTHGILMLNSNAQEYAFTAFPSLTFRTIGGILDFYVFMGPSPEQVVQQYTGAIGYPVMPPYWALGFQLCRYGYNNIDNLKAAVESTAAYDIPHDVQYADIDHMDAQKIFTVNHKDFPDLDGYFKELQSKGMRIIYILDPCMIAEESNYEPYTKMKEVGGNIKWDPSVVDMVNDSMKDSDDALLGYVWPEGKSVFPDYLKTNVKRVWEKLIIDYRSNLTFDGIWIDMNEPASFGTNEEKPWNWPDGKAPWSLVCPKNKWEDPPYRPMAAYRWDGGNRKSRLSDKTICMSTRQGNNDTYSHYDVHSLYGWSQSDTTLFAVRNATGERSFVISRSTFPGSGQYVGHWLGDNESKWQHLKDSIVGILEFNLFGIPYIGADICGFFQNTTASLCLRWMQLGAFYTFSRNHNGINFKEQGPGQLGDAVGIASRDIMRIRYKLLPYLYTLFHKAHTEGSTVIRPVHHEFPTDTKALSIDEQFMWGSCLLISPILEEEQTVLNYYLPRGKWYNYYTHQGEEISQGAMKSMSVKNDSMPLLHLRGGCIIIEQEYANNTHFSRQKPLTIVAALDMMQKANGDLFWDDGSSVDTFKNNTYYMASFSVENNSMKANVTHMESQKTSYDSLYFGKAVVLGVEMNVTNVFLTQTPSEKLAFNQTEEALFISLNRWPMRNDLDITWEA